MTISAGKQTLRLLIVLLFINTHFVRMINIMELTSRVKEFIEDNYSLLDSDPKKFVQDFLNKYGNFEDVGCLVSVLSTALPDVFNFNAALDYYIKELQKTADAKTKSLLYHIDFEIKSRPGDEYGFVAIYMTPKNIKAVDGDAVCAELTLEYDQWFTDWTTYLVDVKTGQKSAVLSTRGMFDRYFNLLDIYLKLRLTDSCAMLESKIKHLSEAIDKCYDSFTWRKQAEEQAAEAAPKMQKVLDDVLGYGKVVIKTMNTHGNNFIRVTTDSSVSTSTIKSDFIFDRNNSNVDLDERLSYWEHDVKRFKERQEKKAAQTTPQITRRDINKAIESATGYDPTRYVAYTNKYNNSTTYKYSGLKLTPTLCTKLKNELEQMGAEVNSVEVKPGGVGRGMMIDSLFINIKN